MVPAYNLERFPDLHPPFDRQSALAEANRCLYCFDAPCTAACPTHIDVPRFIKKIASGNLRGSAATILDANILGLSCSRVCPVDVLCEGSCVMHRYNKRPIEIGRLQRFAMEHATVKAGRLLRESRLPGNGRPSVACIGAGPASLACAAEVVRQGGRAVVFERRPLAGGLNTYGVAEYKLRPSVALQEVEMIREMGVEFRQADIDVAALDAIEREFEFIFVGIGLGNMDRLNIPGEDSERCTDALSFIAAYKTDPPFDIPERVAVIGGGNTAIDAANAARRLGASSVHIFYRRGEAQMPAFPFEYEHSKLEGVHFHFQAQPVEITQKGVRFVRTVSSGKNVKPVPGTEFEFECDLVIPALGQSRASEIKSRIDNEKYFGGGDCLNGGREVVDAVADGKRAAGAILDAARRGEVRHG
jgi:dihydropyrimidine dehydrogenase (NAD+) subunit PreT